jgi:hypothetical protein
MASIPRHGPCLDAYPALGQLPGVEERPQLAGRRRGQHFVGSRVQYAFLLQIVVQEPRGQLAVQGVASAATAAEWIATLFAGHVARENDLLLPVLTRSGADLAALLADMSEPPGRRD